jgi:tetratricopeptide (TPR) repeat protein
LYNLALSYIRQRDWPNVIDALSGAISRDPNRADYYYQLGNAHFQIATDPANAESAEGGAHFDQARTAFTNAIQKDAHQWKAHYLLGQVAEALDDPAGAMRAYTDTLQMAPRAYGAYARLGALYRNNHFYHEAEQVLREGLRIAPPGARERADMHNALGLTLLRENQNLPATEEFLGAVHEDPEHVDALFSLGMTYADMPDRRPQAILYLGQFIAARGGNSPPEYLQQAQDRLGALQNGTAP